jgi:hypothetical protein
LGYTKPEGWDKEHLQEPCLKQPPKGKKHIGKTVSSHPPKTAKTVSSDPPKTVNTMASFKTNGQNQQQLKKILKSQEAATNLNANGGGTWP